MVGGALAVEGAHGILHGLLGIGVVLTYIPEQRDKLCMVARILFLCYLKIATLNDSARPSKPDSVAGCVEISRRQKVLSMNVNISKTYIIYFNYFKVPCNNLA